jgi:large subunit ribosomal protein L10e
MGLRPGRCYRKIQRPNTRVSSTKPRKSYVKGVPRPKIQTFQFGKSDPSKYDKAVQLVGTLSIQVRSEALEAARVMAVQQLEKEVGKDNWFFRVRPYPHHVLRENPMATGAGADRFQQGMRQSFGNPIGSAAQVRDGQVLMEAWVSAGFENKARIAMNSARYKLPNQCKIVVRDLN